MKVVGFDRFVPDEERGPPPIADGWAGEEVARPLRFKTAAEFCAEYVPLTYAVEPIVRTGSLYTLTARTGAGKTALFILVALAVAAGRSDLLGFEVERGRVALLTFENPDDVRMRLLIAAFMLNISLGDVADHLVILDERAKPEDIVAQLSERAGRGGFRLVLVDTLAAFFDGDNINDSVQGGNFMRRLRPMTKLPGAPAVLVAAHPVKNATEDQLVPYGSGAILNEVDGNLTLWRKPDGGAISLHWQGKLRGLEFKPRTFKIDDASSPDVLDGRGRQVTLPVMTVAVVTEADTEAREAADASTRLALLRALLAEPGASLRTLSVALQCSKTRVAQLMNALEKTRLVERPTGRWVTTAKGEKEVERWSV